MSTFLGWMPDAATQAALADLQHRIRAVLPANAPRHDWRTPAQWHITLRYLGAGIDDVQHECINAAMSAIAARATVVHASLVGAQYWPHANVLVGQVDASEAIEALLSQLEAAMQGCGFASGRPQIAHVTLAHLASRQVYVEPALSALTVPMRIDRVQLLRTVPGGYMSLASWPLASTSMDA